MVEPDFENSARAGVVMIDDFPKVRLVAKVEVPRELIEPWTTQGRKQIIVHVEMWPVLVALRRLSTYLKPRRVLVLIDSISAKDAYIRGTFPLGGAFVMLAQAAAIISKEGSAVGLTRVPPSNPSDVPCRNRCQEMAEILGARADKEWKTNSILIQALLEGSSFVDFMAAQILLPRTGKTQPKISGEWSEEVDTACDIHS